MDKGPPVATLTDWLTAIPSDFLRMPIMAARGSGGPGTGGEIEVPVVVSDLIYDTGGAFPGSSGLSYFQKKPAKENRDLLGLILITCHLLHHREFTGRKGFSGKIMKVLKNRKLNQLSKIVPYRDFITDPDRREELVRFVLMELGLLPAGESETSARDRLTTLDSIERERVIKKTKKAQQRAQELREAMKRREAEEAASKWSRE